MGEYGGSSAAVGYRKRGGLSVVPTLVRSWSNCQWYGTKGPGTPARMHRTPMMELCGEEMDISY